MLGVRKEKFFLGQGHTLPPLAIPSLNKAIVVKIHVMCKIQDN